MSAEPPEPGGAGKLPGELAEVVGPRHVLVDPEVTASYVVDWTGRFHGSTPAVVRPGSTSEVAEVVRRCRRAGAPLCLQGGNTGLVGGGVPLHHEVVLTLERLGAVGDVDRSAGQVTAGAAVTIGQLQRAGGAGWSYGVDLASRDSATVGGSVATNAGGVHVLRYGPTRAQVLGVEAVLGDGSVISHLGGLLKDNTGYDLAALLCGSEGTLGVVTRARLRLVPATPERVVALLGFDSVAPSLRAAAELRRDVTTLSAAEFFLAPGLQLVCRHRRAAAPFDRPFTAYLVVEAAGRTDPTDELAEAIGSLGEVGDVAVAVDGPSAERLWAYREGHTEAINALGPPHKLDVALPPSRLPGFVAEVPAVVAAVAPEADVWLFGHAADGNVHVNVTGVAPEDPAVDEAVFGLTAREGGSISAEHGIGTAKVRWLALNRSPSELAAFSALRRAFDPDHILNPHVLVAPDR